MVSHLYPLLLARGGILYINTSGFTINTLSYSMFIWINTIVYYPAYEFRL